MSLRPLSTFPARALARVERHVGAVQERVRTRKYRAQVDSVAADAPTEYRKYVAVQAERSIRRRANNPGVGQRILVEAAAAAAPDDAAILCVGCRNGLELDAFRARGLTDVRGIDIFSQRDDILVMDMHRMTFADGSFGVVYSSHSLEHAFDLERAVGELARVARDGAVMALEVPVAHKGSDADLVVFDGVGMLETLFAGQVGEVLLREEEPAFTPRNDQGSTVARLVFRLRKDAELR